jgi:acyl-CoA thioesterase-1
MTIVVLGDSLTSGHGIGQAAAFPSVLQAKLDAARLPYRIVNAGISGDTTAGGVRRITNLLHDQVSVLLLALGINDGLRGIPVAPMKANLATIIRAAQARGIRVLLCRMEALPIYGRDYTF